MPAGSALIVANAEYRDTKLRRLRAPSWDAKALGQVLRDPAIGDFDVELALDDPEHVVRRKIARFFRDRSRDELLLLHVSCHGLKDDDGHLFFATIDTEFDHLDSTAVPADFVHRQMAKSRSGRIVLLLDCCYSGAFSRGLAPRGGEGVELKERFAERGRAVIAASNAMEYSFEGDEFSGEPKPAVFTAAVVKALETGRADRDGDGWISIDELYDYVYEEVSESSPQRPVKWVDLEGDLRIAKSVYVPPVRAAELPADLRNAITSPMREARLGAVYLLSELRVGSDLGLARGAGEALELLAGDDSRRVSEAARGVLSAQASAQSPAASSSSFDAAQTEAGLATGDAEAATAAPPLGQKVDSRTENAWRSGSQEVLRLLHGGRVLDVAFSRDGRYLATAASTGSARVWELSSGRLLLQVRHDDQVEAVAFSPDGRHLGTASWDKTAAIWQLPEGARLLRLKHQGRLFASRLRGIAFSRDGLCVATASNDKTARVWQMPQGRQVMQIKYAGFEAWVRDVALSVDGRYLATAGDNGRAGVWEIPLGTPIVEVEHRRGVRRVALSPDRRCLATAGGRTACVWEIPTGRLLLELVHDDDVQDVEFGPKGGFIATGSNDRTAIVWEMSSGQKLSVIEPEHAVEAVAFSPDGRCLATGGVDGTARVWAARKPVDE